MTNTPPSRAVEDFLKAVYSLQQKTPDRVSTNSLAEALNIAAPTVTDMARRMEDAGLLDYRKYHGMILTDEGMALALRVLRRHRLLELYLVQELGYALHEVHHEAENLEHAVSDRFIEAIATKLGNPTLDPHGDPIPAVDGTIIRRNLVSLNVLELNTRACVSRFTADNDDMLQHILNRNFRLGVIVQVTHRDPFEGPLTVVVDGDENIIGHAVADHILVEVGE
ncbi:MAG: metal-dependent transcriptional regulator [Anaerolineae bacterium]|jgi:DtxR family Mn-dependent transcriptional regulator|nr:metal-dependent transcriptional regulator [Anaerolineae bacterium]